MGRPLARPLGLLQLSGETSCIPVTIRERDSLTGNGSRVPVSVVGVIPWNVETPQKVGNGDSELVPLEVISLMVTRLLRTAQEGLLADEKVPLEKGMGSSSAWGRR